MKDNYSTSLELFGWNFEWWWSLSAETAIYHMKNPSVPLVLWWQRLMYRSFSCLNSVDQFFIHKMLKDFVCKLSSTSFHMLDITPFITQISYLQISEKHDYSINHQLNEAFHLWISLCNHLKCMTINEKYQIFGVQHKIVEPLNSFPPREKKMRTKNKLLHWGRNVSKYLISSEDFCFYS